MIKPVQQDAELLRDVLETGTPEGHFSLWWLGQSGFLLQWANQHLLFDPYLSDSLTTKYASTDKPHVRMTKRVIAPNALRFVDVVTSSHNHTDHLDAETLQPILAGNPKCKFVIPEANRAFVTERLKLPEVTPIGLNAGETTKIGEFEIFAVPAAHEDLATDKEGRHIYLGYVVKFGSWSVYHSGDTVIFPGMVEWLKPHAVTVALLPINGRAPERPVSGNLDGSEAAQLAKEIGAGVVIPCHYEMFEFNTASPESFEATAEQLGQSFKTLKAGGRWTSFSMDAQRVAST